MQKAIPRNNLLIAAYDEDWLKIYGVEQIAMDWLQDWIEFWHTSKKITVGASNGGLGSVRPTGLHSLHFKLASMTRTRVTVRPYP